MHKHGLLLLIILIVLAAALPTAAGDKIITFKKVQDNSSPQDHQHHPAGRTPYVSGGIRLPLERTQKWALPNKALSPEYDTTLHILALRFNFQKEVPDDPLTTGIGIIDTTNPIANPIDSAHYFDSVGNWFDRPPRDSAYFDAHLQALARYWSTVSNGKLRFHEADSTPGWTIYPPGKNSAYTLQHNIRYYGGECDPYLVGERLEDFFEDCIRTADTMHLVDPIKYPEIDFSQYDIIYLFHAGTDRQNNDELGISGPNTCCDLFTGYIAKFPKSPAIAVNNGTDSVRSAIIMPETSSQDNRAVVINAEMAHEFGHSLGLVDLYNTRRGLNVLGDFALMDYNGFGTGLESSPEMLRGGSLFGALPIFPSAWSRAYLGFDEVVDFRKGSDIRLVAAEVLKEGIKIARVPISENEYYLIEVRNEDLDGVTEYVGIKPDSATGVILGPGTAITADSSVFNREYDALIPGTGMLIYLVDESVAFDPDLQRIYMYDSLNFKLDTLNFFESNRLQIDSTRLFITLMEADGIRSMNGYNSWGYGDAEDMYREDHNHTFTPNTNPPAIDNTGNNTHVYVENITRLDTLYPGESEITTLDSIMLFDLETRDLVDGFPVRVGPPQFGLNAVVDDIDRDGTDEVIVASGPLLSVMTSVGKNFLYEYVGGFDSSLIYYDSALALVNGGAANDPFGTQIMTHRDPQPVPLYYQAPDIIWAGPVTGGFTPGANKLVAVGYPTSGTVGNIIFLESVDLNNNGRADFALDLDGDRINFPTFGRPIALSFGEKFYCLTDMGFVYEKTGLDSALISSSRYENDIYHGICRDGNDLILHAGNADVTKLYYIGDRTDSIIIDGVYNLGPVLADVDLAEDSLPEVIIFSNDGVGVIVGVDTSATSIFSIKKMKNTGGTFSVNPVVGDIDLDGYPDIVVGGINAVYAFNSELITKTNYPIIPSDRFLEDTVIAPPIVADFMKQNELPEILFPTVIGNVYSFGPELSFGFPRSAGEKGVGSGVVFSDSTGGRIGYYGADGWFYAWETSVDTVHNFWPMGGHDPAGTFSFPTQKLGAQKSLAGRLPEEQFYNYPNPVKSGTTTIRYYLGETATSVTLAIYDLSGREVEILDGGTTGGTDNEITWNCGNITPGVYRCIIKAEFTGGSETAFTDIAVLK